MSCGFSTQNVCNGSNSVEDDFEQIKVSRKDKPTYLLRAQDSLHKIAPKKLIEEFP